MSSTWEWVTLSSSLLLRLSSYIFLRWIPGNLMPQAIGTLFTVYVASWAWVVLTTSPYDIVAEEVDIVTKPVENGSAAGKGSTNDEPVEELDVEDTIVAARKPPHAILTLLTGVPSTSLLFSLLSFGINVVLFLFMVDATYRAAVFYPASDLSFTRLGYVSESSARILVREPDATALPIFLSYRYADVPVMRGSGAQFDSSWKHAGSIAMLSEDTDFTSVFIIDNLRPDTRYQYALSNNFTGHFITAPAPGSVSHRETKSDPLTDLITDDDQAGSFKFVHSSCLKSHFPYNPFDDPLTLPGMRPLAQVLARIRPAFFLFLGDFIYVDVPSRHGSDVDNYRREYRQVYASPEWKVGTHIAPGTGRGSQDEYELPWIHVYDDHEIANDWSANTTGVFPAAFDPYTHYHIAANPPSSGYSNHIGLLSKKTQSSPVDTDTYTTFVQGPASFFLLDTRRYRSDPCTSKDLTCDSTMLGDRQLKALLMWLNTPPKNPGIRWKIMVSSVPFTRNWRVNAQDTWGGYLKERRMILDAMWDAGSDGSGTGIVVLSGDRHEHATTAFPPPPGSKWDLAAPGGEATAVEFSTSPLSMFYLPWRTYREDPPEVAGRGDYAVGRERETCLKYNPEGNSKLGAVEIEAPKGSGQSLLRYTLYVDGKETWSHVLVAPERRRSSLRKWKEGAWE